jgi:hypothetical protein
MTDAVFPSPLRGGSGRRPGEGSDQAALRRNATLEFVCSDPSRPLRGRPSDPLKGEGEGRPHA